MCPGMVSFLTVLEEQPALQLPRHDTLLLTHPPAVSVPTYYVAEDRSYVITYTRSGI